MLPICIRHINEFRASGLTDKTLQAHKIWSIDQSDAEKILGFGPKSGGWGIEYPGTNGTGPAFIRIKPDVPFTDENGRPAKYLTAKGAGNRLFISAIYTEQELRFSKTPIIITEGEKKALKGAQDLPGFVVVGLAGVWCFKEKGKALISDFKKICWKDRDVYIVYDSDLVSKPEVKGAEHELAVQLDKLEVGAVYLGRLPAKSNGEKNGLDDYLVSHSAETFVEQILDRALIWSPRCNIQVENCPSFVDRRIESQEDIIGGGILPAQSLCVISAYSKIGKSIFAMNQALCIACGKDFLNQFEVAKPRRILYVNEEISEKGMQTRLKIMIEAARSEGFKHFSNFDLVNRSGIRIDTNEGLVLAKRLIRFRRPDVVYWDCLYRLHSKNENWAENMQMVMDRFDYLTRTFKIAQAIIHHHGQPQKDSARDNFQLMRGSSVIGAAGDSYLTLTRHSKKELSNYQRLSFDLRNAASPEDLKVYRNPDTSGTKSAVMPNPNGS